MQRMLWKVSDLYRRLWTKTNNTKEVLHMKNVNTVVILLVTIVLIFSLSGCSALFLTKDIIQENVDTETSEIIESNNDDEKESVIDDSILIQTKYFNLKLPKSWEGKYKLEMSSDFEYDTYSNYASYYVQFKEKSNCESGYGGHLFTIVLTDDSQYDNYGIGNKFGEMKMDKKYYLYVVNPTDVQFSFDFMDVYKELSNNQDEILRSILPKDSSSTITLYD